MKIWYIKSWETIKWLFLWSNSNALKSVKLYKANVFKVGAWGIQNRRFLNKIHLNSIQNSFDNCLILKSNCSEGLFVQIKYKVQFWDCIQKSVYYNESIITRKSWKLEISLNLKVYWFLLLAFFKTKDIANL